MNREEEVGEKNHLRLVNEFIWMWEGHWTDNLSRQKAMVRGLQMQRYN